MDTLQQDNLTGVNNGPLMPNLPLKYLTATSIIGDKVHNKEGDHMGDIKNIMLDVTTGKIEYFVVEFGGFLGIGTKYFAIPFALLHVDAENKLFVFSQSREMLENAPGFNEEHWPDTNIHLEQMHGYWSFMG
ncbi:MAG: PRC-barrel domain-containing protein [Bacteroidota bacterium]